MAASKSAMQALVDIFVAPGAAFRAAETNRKWFWIPVLIILAGGALLWVWYFSVVDFDWYREQALAASGRELSAEELEQAKKFMQPGTIIGSTVVFITIFIVLLYLVEALYFHIVAKVSGDRKHGYGDWFNFAAWAGMPGLISILAGCVVILTAGSSQIDQQSLSPLSLNSLIFKLPVTHPWAAFATAVNLPLFWSVGLMGLGLTVWTGRSLAKSTMIAAAPFVVVFGLWALVIG